MNLLSSCFRGKRVLITVGSTREYLDPVRFLSNGSSGKMGLECAQQFLKYGAKVTLICGPGIESSKIPFIPVVSARDLYKAVQTRFPHCDIFISASAVCDWRPEKFSSKKTSKVDRELYLKLVPNPDILALVAKSKKKQFCVGFALENSSQEFHKAKKKMTQKNCDLMVLNDLSSMGGEWMRASLLFKEGQIWNLGRVKKKECAKKICQAILKAANR